MEEVHDVVEEPFRSAARCSSPWAMPWQHAIQVATMTPVK
jgi:hypothetical protein